MGGIRRRQTPQLIEKSNFFLDKPKEMELNGGCGVGRTLSNVNVILGSKGKCYAEKNGYTIAG